MSRQAIPASRGIQFPISYGTLMALTLTAATGCPIMIGPLDDEPTRHCIEDMKGTLEYYDYPRLTDGVVVNMEFCRVGNDLYSVAGSFCEKDPERALNVFGISCDAYPAGIIQDPDFIPNPAIHKRATPGSAPPPPPRNEISNQ